MSVAIGIWSHVLEPGKEEVVIPQADLRITNVALGDVLKDASGRTTVKLTYNTLVKLDEDDEDEEDVPEPLSTTVLCSLTGGKIEQTTTDIILEEDQEYTFQAVGKNTIYLTGNYIDQTSANAPPFGDDDSDMDSEDDYDLREVSSDVEIDPAELGSDASRFEEMEEDETPAKGLKRSRDSDVMDTDSVKPTKADKKAKKQKAEDGKAVTPSTSAAEGKKETKEKKEKKEKKPEAAAEGKKEKAAPVEKEIAGGIKIMDSKVGTGAMAKKGKKISMRYIGKLQNGTIFDQNIKGKPFTFRLGGGEVIKGWDEGIVGMQVGGERKLTLPPAMAYGKKGVSGIPPNSTLIFECKLMEVK